MEHPERILPPETSPGILALHLKRYDFALAWAEDAEVLDAGCGAGYGTAHLARAGRHVVGLDLSPEALDYAREHYAAANVEYVHGDLASLPFENAAFDLICAFETIEHLDDPEAFAAEAARLLRDGGTLLVSTPRAQHTTRMPANPHHRVELSAAELERILHLSFGDVRLLGQRRIQTRRHRVMQRLDAFGLRRRARWLEPAAMLLGTPPTTQVTLDGIVIEPGELERATELVAVCSRPLRP